MKKRITVLASIIMAVALAFSSAAAPGIYTTAAKADSSATVQQEAAAVQASEEDAQTKAAPAATDTQAAAKSSGDVDGVLNISHTVTIDGVEYDLLSLTDMLGAMLKINSTGELKYVSFSYLDYGITKLLSKIANAIPAPSTVTDIDDYVSENFYEGNTTFINESGNNARWSLGYSQASLVPGDILEKDYYLAGYLLQNLPANNVETVLDDMKVRTVTLDDGSGRGISTYSTIECIGLMNNDIREIRSRVAAAIGNEFNINSINVYSTHCHSEIDTMGLWNPILKKIANNIMVNSTGEGELESGTDPEFMELLYTRVSQSIIDACRNMKTGELYSAQKDVPQYFFDDRDPSYYLSDLTRLRFVPDDANAQETIIVNMGAHPYVTGLKTDISSGKELSADFTYYMEEVINAAGFNFMFFPGAINGIYENRGASDDGVTIERRSEEAERYGRELGRVTLAMTLTEEEILADELLANTAQVEADKLESAQNISAGSADTYTLWYEDWEPVEETEVEPILNIRLKEVKITVENPIIMAVGKLGLCNYNILEDHDGTYCAYTEIGYLEIGKDLHIAFMPGEFEPQLVTGESAAKAEFSFSLQDFQYPSMEEIAGTDLIIFGLANDEVGYIVPDNDYCMIFFEDMQPFGDHYQEALAFGRHTASTLIKGFIDLIDDVNSIR